MIYSANPRSPSRLVKYRVYAQQAAGSNGCCQAVLSYHNFERVGK